MGVFVRTPKGSTIEYVSDHATDDTALFAYVIMAGIYKLPAELVADVRKAYDAIVKRSEEEEHADATRRGNYGAPKWIGAKASKRKPRA